MTEIIDFVVRNVEMKDDPRQPIFNCEMEGRGRKVSFFLILPKEPVGWSAAPAQYAAVSPHLRAGSILSCELVYIPVYQGFIAALVRFYEQEVRDAKTDKVLDGDTYFNLGENPLVIKGRAGPVVLIPGVITLCGDAFVPMFGMERIKHTREEPRSKPREGLRWDRRPPWIRRWWWNRIAQRRGFIVGPT